MLRSLSDEFVVQLKQERDQLNGQVKFLNSIIVDMQEKNSKLESSLEILKMGKVPDEAQATA